MSALRRGLLFVAVVGLAVVLVLIATSPTPPGASSTVPTVTAGSTSEPVIAHIEEP